MHTPEPDPPDDSESDVILRPLLSVLWRYRRAILSSLAVLGISYVAVLATMYALLPRERLASLGFRLLFAGAEQGQYPNGTRFSSAEITAVPVLTEVFAKNQLDRYVSFQPFKDSMFVLSSNPNIEMLDDEYQTKLSDPKLSSVDRSRLEEEYRKKRETLKSAQFSLVMRRHDRLLAIPEPLLQKTLADTVSTWAQQAAERKGASRYNVSVLSKGSLQHDFVAAQDYIVAVDVLRNTAERLLSNVGRIEKIPGAAVVRYGSDRLTLADIRARVEDLLRFRIEPLFHRIAVQGLTKDVIQMDDYLRGRLLQAQMARAEAAQRVRVMQDTLAAYQNVSFTAPSGKDAGLTGMVPQVTESFIDKLVDLSTKSNDLDYRQEITRRMMDEGMVLSESDKQVAYYEALQKTTAGSRKSVGPRTTDVDQLLSEAFATLSRNIEDVERVYDLVSIQDLNPDSVMYVVTSPFVVRTVSPMTPRTAFVYFVMLLAVACIIIPAICLVHAYLTGSFQPKSIAQTARLSRG